MHSSDNKWHHTRAQLRIQDIPLLLQLDYCYDAIVINFNGTKIDLLCFSNDLTGFSAKLLTKSTLQKYLQQFISISCFNTKQ